MLEELLDLSCLNHLDLLVNQLSQDGSTWIHADKVEWIIPPLDTWAAERRQTLLFSPQRRNGIKGYRVEFIYPPVRMSSEEMPAKQHSKSYWWSIALSTIAVLALMPSMWAIRGHGPLWLKVMEWSATLGTALHAALVFFRLEANLGE